MITFIVGLIILFVGYFAYSKYVESNFSIENEMPPSIEINDGVDFVPLSLRKNALIHLLNIAGLGPILGAIQGVLFGPIAFLLIPLGCVFMGGVHDYFSGMLSMKNKGAQITELINKYLGKNYYRFFMVIVSVLLLLLASVFVYTAGDIIAERFFHQTDFSLLNPVILSVYGCIFVYYIVASLFPIDKIIGRFYPVFGFLLIFGTLLILAGFFIKGVNLDEFNIFSLNKTLNSKPIIPYFFLTVSCGLLSGFHSTQSTIVSRTITTYKDGKKIFYGMMCLESLICMIWAAAAMSVYNSRLVPDEIIGTANVINSIADVFVPYLAFIVTFAVVILPITSGDTALRGLRMILGESFNLKQKQIKNRLIIIIPVILIMISTIIWAKSAEDSFSSIWRYFNFVNQLIAIPTFLYATIYLYKSNKNFLITFIPALFYIFITSVFILNSQIGFNLGYKISLLFGAFIVFVFLIYFVFKKLKN